MVTYVAMVVDDERITLDSIVRSIQTIFRAKDPELSKTEIEVIGTTNPHEALSSAREIQRDPQYVLGVVVADYIMPQMDGISLIRNLRETNPDLYTVILTAHADEANVETGRSQGLLDIFMEKPIPEISLRWNITNGMNEYLRRVRTRKLEAENLTSSMNLQAANQRLENTNRYLSRTVVASMGTSIRQALKDDPEVVSCLRDYVEAAGVAKFIDAQKHPSGRVNVLLTGATGFLGSAYLREVLMCRDPNIHFELLVRDSREVPFDQRISVPEEYKDRIHPVKGDATKRHFGMNDVDWGRVTNQAHYIVHCAASTNYEDQVAGQNFKQNVLGAMRLVEFARHCEKLARVVYVGTAYVEGKPKISSRDEDPGEVFELGPLDDGHWMERVHRNEYEATKFLASQVIHSNRDLPFVEVRPTIVVGSSEDGYCNETTMYFFAKSFQIVDDFLKTRPMERKVRIAMDPSVPKNFVCVDDVVALMDMARVSEYAHQKVLHLASPENITIAEVTSAISTVLGLGIEIMGEGPIDQPKRYETRLASQHEIYRGYTDGVMGRDPRWRLDNTLQVISDVVPGFQFHPVNQGRLEFLFRKYLEHPTDAMTLNWKR